MGHGAGWVGDGVCASVPVAVAGLGVSLFGQFAVLGQGPGTDCCEALILWDKGEVNGSASELMTCMHMLLLIEQHAHILSKGGLLQCSTG